MMVAQLAAREPQSQSQGENPLLPHFAVAPDNPDDLYFAGSFTVSLDGGLTSHVANGLASPGGDNHAIWIDPSDGRPIVVGNDGGVSVSVNRGETWNRVQLPIAQMLPRVSRQHGAV